MARFEEIQNKNDMCLELTHMDEGKSGESREEGREGHKKRKVD